MSIVPLLDPKDIPMLPSACVQLFGHEYWQVLSDENLIALHAFITADEPCGYCGSSQDPNDICFRCFTNLKGE